MSNKMFVNYLGNTSWLVLEKILRIFIALFVGVWVARFLGPKQFGLLSFAQSFVTIFGAIATLGLDSIVVREVVKNEDSSNEILGTAFILKLIGGIFVVGIVYLTSLIWHDEKVLNTLVLLISTATLFQSFNVIGLYFQAKVISKYTVYASFVSLIVASVLKVYFIINNYPLVYFAGVIMLEAAVLSIGLLFFYRKLKFSVINWKVNLCLSLNLLKDSWPLILSGIVISIYMKMDQIMLKELLSSEAVGIYAAAVRLSEAWYFVPMVITASLFPAIISFKEQCEKLYLRRMQQLYDMMVLLSFGIAIITSFLSKKIIIILYGSEFQEAADVLMIHIWTGVFVFIGVASSKWFIVENLQKFTLYRTFCGAVINVLLNFILIPICGVLGAAFATLISQIIASFLFNVLFKETRITFTLQLKALLIPIRIFLKNKY